MRIIWIFLLLTGCSLWTGTYGKTPPPSVERIAHLLPEDLGDLPPKVVIALLVRNKAHVLPLALTYLDQLDYPKDRIALWIRSDHNSDASVAILSEWLKHVEPLYHSVDKLFNDTEQRHEDEKSLLDWPQARFHHLISLKEEAFVYAQKIWADYIFYLDADVLLTEPRTLKHLTDLGLPIVAPMLLSEGLYSNFWCGMTPDYYYLRTDMYREIYNVQQEGVFQVPMIHSAVLINVNYNGSSYLTFDRENLRTQLQNGLEYAASLGEQCRMYDGPVDDIIVFAISANCSKIPLFITNEVPFGYILQPLENTDQLEQDYKQLQNIKTNIIHDLGQVAEVKEYLKPFERKEEKDKLTLDHIYMINLERRPERREKMLKLFEALNLDVEYFPAVDGKRLTPEMIKELGIKFLPGYEDPYHHRPMTLGEIGCFLSHYHIWQTIVEKQQKEVLILEDDIRFEPYFKEKALGVMEQIRKVIDYDLVDKLTLDHIYMINLERRPERREKMLKLFEALNLDVEYFPAVDGKRLTPEMIKELGIKFLPGYEDPYHHRPMTLGEIGCFLSHYHIWQTIVEKQQKEVLILEDDIRFEPYFKEKALGVMEQIRKVIDYDLVYFGRKRLKDEVEPWVDNTENLVHAGYSYWTLGYVISLKGAEKLLKAKPLEKLLPVDEFLPIMFNRHPNKTWAEAFPERDLLAFSAAPLLLYPTHYTGDYGYISDTEDSYVIESHQTNKSPSAAQLKSDPERSFLVEPRLDSPNVDLSEQTTTTADAKSRDEF